MVEAEVEEIGDRILIRLDPGGPIELTGLTESFAALARLYERHYRPVKPEQAAPKLYITKLATGSIIAEIAPLFPLISYAYMTAGGAVTVADFVRRLHNGLRAFSDMEEVKPEELPSHDDAEDLREFVRPLTGRKNATLGISHARYRSKSQDREVVVEYEFDSDAINRASLNIDKFEETTRILDIKSEMNLMPSGRIRKEVMLFFQQASRAPSKEEGRTGDKAVIPEIDDKPHPTYFRKGVNDLKDQMVRGIENPLKCTFVVDVHVQVVEGRIKGYVITDVHKVIPEED